MSSNKAGPQEVGAKALQKWPGEDGTLGRRWFSRNPGGRIKVGSGRPVGPCMGEEVTEGSNGALLETLLGARCEFRCKQAFQGPGCGGGLAGRKRVWGAW